MFDRVKDAGWLKDKEVVFTGRLASLSRADASSLVESLGGRAGRAVTHRTDFLVVGQASLPITSKGALTRRLRMARAIQKDGIPCILAEQDFIERLDLADQSPGVHRRYTMAQLCRLLRIPRSRLRRWVHSGLIHPVDTLHGLEFFSFQQVTAVKTLWELVRAGVPARRIRRSLELLKGWLPATAEPLTQLGILERDGVLLFRLQEGHLAEPTGQLHFDFDDNEDPPIMVEHACVARTAEDLWEQGLEFERAGDFQHAAVAYREALAISGPQAALCFNLGNALQAVGQIEEAAEQFRLAVDLDPTFAEAWNNLGNIFSQLKQCTSAEMAYERALQLLPNYADAHYNLADLLEQQGRSAPARTHWRAYLTIEPVGPWADHARRHCL
jgi:DNA-binding transcriptional MerR regulator